MKSMLSALSFLALFSGAVLAAGGKAPRILFIGNSYTAGSAKTFRDFVGSSPYAKAKLEFIVKGGFTLQKHLKNKATVKKIETGQWDMVVLQEQSQVPSFPLPYSKPFHDSANRLADMVKSARSKPVFFLTWGRRDGDKGNKQVNPDYKTMQDNLTKAYRTAAHRNKARLAPVGEAWRLVWKGDANLARRLYAGDGSHPSPKGAFLNACVLYGALFGENPESVKFNSVLDKKEAQVLKKMAWAALQKEKKVKAKP